MSAERAARSPRTTSAGRGAPPVVRTLVALCAAAAVAGAAGDPGAPDPARGAERVVSLVPAATETLFELGAGELVVGVGSHATWPPEVDELPRVGALLDPDIERILALRPDLVIIDPGQATLAAQLGAAGIRHMDYAVGTIDEALEAMRGIGAQVGHGAAGDRLADRIASELDRVRASTVGSRRSVVLVFGRRTRSFANLYVNGGVGFLNELVEIAGGDNVFGDVAHPSFKAGLEAVLARRPEVVIEARPQMKPDDPAIEGIVADWKGLPGFGDVDVAVVTGAALVLPGPRMPQAARALARMIAGSRARDGGRSSPPGEPSSGRGTISPTVPPGAASS